MCLRKIQKWDAPSRINEFLRFNSMEHSESKFVEKLTHVSVPSCTPLWLWNGQKLKEHPLLKLSYCHNNKDEMHEIERESIKELFLREVDQREQFRESRIQEKEYSHSVKALALEGASPYFSCATKK
ncbi:uncharacterized protein LOC135120978 [Zophobas morio]|uniref:uncharacterized protein LOC135120978 n=1 Tax=Zophobas morio TaxID=2755281 RepID=UPI0030827913